LCDELCGVELSNDRLQDFIADGGENSLVVVLAEILELRLATAFKPFGRRKGENILDRS
jgi:hypothetical protein